VRFSRRGRARGVFIESFEMAIDIDRSLGEVFAFVSDLGNDPGWRREWVEAKRTTENPIG